MWKCTDRMLSRVGDFPNVPGHVSNPENVAVFDAPIEYAKTTLADVILATDPDCDRLGVAAPKTLDASMAWGTFNGNQIGALWPTTSSAPCRGRNAVAPALRREDARDD